VRPRTILLIVLLPVLIAGVVGFIHLQANINSYDQKYTDCMEVKKSWLPGYHFNYPSPEYTAATEDCERQAR